jgi:HEAT repeat protein
MEAAMARRLISRLLGSPEGATPAQLNRQIRRGDVPLQVRALREIGAHPEPAAAPLLLSKLPDPAPGARRAAAWALGQLGYQTHCTALLDAAQAERCDEVRLSMAAAAVRCGAPVSEGWAIISQAAAREAMTWYGPRRLADAVGTGASEMSRRWLLMLNPLADDPAALTPLPSPALREESRAVLSADPESRPALKALAAQQHPADLPLLLRSQTARRTRHATTEALGSHGDPRSVPRLLETFRAVVDPGQGFTNRRTAAEALGRLGLPSLGGVLSRALAEEALDFEGRPGAGLGIQYPVRSVLLAALGECGAIEQASLLAGYLSNTHGSAMGGFYLPAMDALWKLGAVAELAALLASPEELVVANALGVLGLLGEERLLRRFRDDERPRVRAAARSGG